MEMEKARAFKGVWIPKEIYFAEDLSWTEKILLLEIDSLDNEEGCFASNEHFAQFLGISKGRASKNISSLIKKGYVVSNMAYKGESRELDRRILHTTIGDSRQRQEGMAADDEPPMVTNDQDSNTTKSNSMKDTNKQKEKGGMNALIAAYTNNQELVESIRGFIQMRAAKKKPLTDRALKMLLGNLDKMESTDEKKIKVLDQSTLNCWQGIFPIKEEKGGENHVCHKESANTHDPFNL